MFIEQRLRKRDENKKSNWTQWTMREQMLFRRKKAKTTTTNAESNECVRLSNMKTKNVFGWKELEVRTKM